MKYFLTLRDNGVQYGPFSKKQYKFMKKALHINEVEERTFCRCDFPELKSENFRQYILKLRNYIQNEIQSYPIFYKIKGVRFRYYKFKKISDTIVGDNMLAILEKLKDQHITLKDIHIKIDSGKELFNTIINMSMESDISIKEILWNNISIDDEVYARVIINPKYTIIEIQCIDRPIVYDMDSAIKLIELLGIISGKLHEKSYDLVKIPSTGDWLCISYRLGTNGQYSYHKPEFYRAWKDLIGGFMRTYSEQIKKYKFNLVIDTRIH